MTTNLGTRFAVARCMRYARLALVLVLMGCTDEHREEGDAGGRDSGHARHDSGVDKDSGADHDASVARDAGKPGDGAVDEDTGVDEPVADASAPEPPDSKCEVTESSPETPNDQPTTNIWTYDPKTRRLVTTVYEYDLDEAGRSLRVYGRQGELTLYWTNHYDSHGNVDVYLHYTSGTYNYTNTYDGDRLVSVELASPDGQSSKTTYRYDDPTMPNVWTHREYDRGPDGTVNSVTDRTIENGRTATTRITDDGQLHHEYTFTWDGDRIDTIGRDGGYWLGDGPDGTPNISFHWVRDENDNVTEFTQDGTDSLDNPFVNGTPDYKETYSSGCAPLLKQFPWLAHEPSPNSIGPRFRTEAD
jgi:hypothetical protein